MASSLTLSLLTAQSGLTVNQQAIDAAAENIANVNSANYTRKVISQEQRVVNGAGAGVQLSDMKRQIDEGLMKSMRLEMSELNKMDIQSAYYERLQFEFGKPGDNNSISHIISEFTGALESMALSPDSTLEQNEALRWAQEVTQELKDLSSTIQELRLQADNAIADNVTTINELTTNIRDYNDLLVRNVAIKTDVSDVMDQRDAAMNQLTELIDARYYFRSDGDMVVFTTSGRTLVDNIPATLIHTPISTSDPTITHAGGEINGIYVDTVTSVNDITNAIQGGQLKGLIDMRDSVLTDLQSQIDELAGEFRDVINQIHNRGTAFPGMKSLTGSREFIEPTTQRIRLNGTSDTQVLLFDANGDQAAQVSLTALMEDLNFGGNVAYDGGTGYANNEYWIVSEMATNIQNWLNDSSLGGGGAITGAGLGLTGNTVAVNAAGNLAISINSTTYSIAFRDENAEATPGSTHTDATVEFDSDSDGDLDADETVSGFSNFFGLNDFFVDGLEENIWETNVMTSTYTAATAATLTFRDSTGLLGTQAVTAGESLTTIRDNINTSAIGVTASVITDGSGSRLRITNDAGLSMTVTQNAGVDTLLSSAELGMHVGDIRVSTTLAVRSDLVSTPAYLARGAVQWDANLGAAGEYYTSVGDDTIIETLSTQLTANNVFDSAGSIGGVTLTLAEYGAAILERNASLAYKNSENLKFQETLTESITYKSDSVRGVNLDEELANLLVYEQAYSASARVISIIQQMFDALERIIG